MNVTSTDPSTGIAVSLPFDETDAPGLDLAVARAARASALLADVGRDGRAALLDAGADALDARAEEIVVTADAETALGGQRLRGELVRTTYQLRFFGEVLREGSYLEAAIDHAGPTPMGPRPDLRRMLVPLGPVAVYAASNFPLAFSVAGGDTAAALAAGNGVVVKAHPAHPRTSALVASILAEVVGEAVSVVYGMDAGRRLVQHPGIRAAGFTGSLAGGRALADLAAARPDPIPFYGELGSINPVLVSPAAAAARAEEIAEGLAGSVTLGGGQFCTKPGLVLVPTGADGDGLVRRLAAALQEVPPRVALTAGMAEHYATGIDERAGVPGARVLVRGDRAERSTAPALIEVTGGDPDQLLTEECFGPLTVVVRYRDDAQAAGVLSALPDALTGTLFLEPDDRGVAQARAALRARAGRLVYNGYPTGVAVSWAQHHGGSWPSTNSLHTSVGATSIRRFLRPMAWQDAPTHELPLELRDEVAAVPRRVDGVLRPATAPPA